jgi:hypothetical protein
MNSTCKVRSKNRLLALAAVLLTAHSAFGQKAISASQAISHVGENSRVCGQVASTQFAYRSRGAPTFINLDEPYPNQIFTALIWAEDRSKFGSPEVRYENRRICVNGVIQLYRGIPEIILRNPSQVEVKSSH